jgi:hypothetical protein
MIPEDQLLAASSLASSQELLAYEACIVQLSSFAQMLRAKTRLELDKCAAAMGDQLAG